MGVIHCEKCGAWRKWGDVITDDGFRLGECPTCGDPEQWKRPPEDDLDAESA